MLEAFKDRKIWFYGYDKKEVISKGTFINDVYVIENGKVLEHYQSPNLQIFEIDEMSDDELLDKVRQHIDNDILEPKTVTTSLYTDDSGKVVKSEDINGISRAFNVTEMLESTEILNHKYKGFIGEDANSSYEQRILFTEDTYGDCKFKFDEIGDENTKTY